MATKKSTHSRPQTALPTADDPTNFERGRDLAAALLGEGHRLGNTDDAEARRWCRGGRAQNCYAKAYLVQLLDAPELLEGFAAVLSACLGTNGGVHPSEYEGLPVAEFMAGVPGEDGTQDLETANEDRADNIVNWPKTAAAAPGRAPDDAAKPPAAKTLQAVPAYPLGGFNAAQIERLFEQIACSASVARSIAAYAAQGGYAKEAMNQFHALQFVLERIGSLAEAVVPGTVYNAPIDWLVGPGFSQLKEVAHG